MSATTTLALPSKPTRQPSFRRRSILDFGGIGAGLVLTFLFVYPLAGALLSIFWSGGQVDLSAFSDVLTIPGLGQTLLNTLIVVVVAGSLSMLIGSSLAWINERTDARMGRVSSILPIIPLLLPGIAAAIGWVFLLAPNAGLINILIRWILPGSEGAQGPLNAFTWAGLLFVYTMELIPLVYLPVSAALRNIDPALEEASRTAGAGPLETLFRVTLPSVKPALGAAAMLVLVAALAIYSVPSVIGTTARIEVLSTLIVSFLRAEYPPRTGEVVVLGLLMLAVILIAWSIQGRILRSNHFSTVGGKGSQATIVKLGRWRPVARTLIVGYVVIAAVLPVIALVSVSVQPFWAADFNWEALSFTAYESVFGSISTRNALVNSLTLGVVGATVTMLLVLLVSLSAWQRSTMLSRFLDSVPKVPAAFPHLVIATGFLIVFTGPPFALAGSLLLIALCYITIYMPQASISAGSAVTQVDRSLVEASHVYGAGSIRTLVKILLPITLPALAVGWTYLFVLMNGDLTASVLLASTSSPTNGYTLIQLWTTGTYPPIAALAVIMTVVSTVTVSTALYVSRKIRGGHVAS